MNKQINIRLPEQFLIAMKKYTEKHGYGSIQEFIKETIREKIFENSNISKKELILVRKLLKASNKLDLYGSEEELFKK